MPRKPVSLDVEPIERAMRIEERDREVASLIHPIYEQEPRPMQWLAVSWILGG